MVSGEIAQTLSIKLNSMEGKCMSKPAQYYRDAAEECFMLATLWHSEDCKQKMITIGNEYLRMAEDVEKHELDVETEVNRVLRRMTRRRNELLPE